MDHDATYSPEDNKLRIYPAYRLDKDDYNRLRSAGFKWAPKQELFVAPMWTPRREDIAFEFCGDIGDEDTSLVDRAEIRAERFDEYSDKRKADAHTAKQTVAAITDHIPFGQPILVGHHSEKRARKDAERIENGMRKAVKMWETSKYWECRAAGALRHAKYKERPDVRARRIKKIEASRRKCVKNITHNKDTLNLWLSPVILSKGRALAITNYLSMAYYKFPLDKYPRNPPASQYEGEMSLWGALDGGIITARQARNLNVPDLEYGIAHNERWLSHYDNRLIYEKAMLGEAGRLDLLEKPKRPKQLPILNYLAPEGLTVENPPYYAEKISHYPQASMTKAEYKEIYSGSRFIRVINKTHRVRATTARHIPGALDGLSGIDRLNKGHSMYCVFLTDSKKHPRPEHVESKPEAPARPINTQTYTQPERTEFDDMKDSLREGVKTVSAPQLFPTPADIAKRVIELADIEPGHNVLEPSAGTGALLKDLPCIRPHGTLTVVEINQTLADGLRETADNTFCADFLSCNGDLGTFDRIIMNPPFINGADIKHIQHARKFLAPGGRLVALCANGPRQRDKLMGIADTWEDLPPDSFKQAGTNVNVALLTIDN